MICERDIGRFFDPVVRTARFAKSICPGGIYWQPQVRNSSVTFRHQTHAGCRFAFFAACVNRAAAQHGLLRLIPMANAKVRLRLLSW
jgi:hypothetical protein